MQRCIEVARTAGHRGITLWTNDNLVAAIRLYQDLGFRLTAEAPHHNFGKDLVGQDWLLEF